MFQKKKISKTAKNTIKKLWSVERGAGASPLPPKYASVYFVASVAYSA